VCHVESPRLCLDHVHSEVMQLNPVKRSRASSGFPRQLQLGPSCCGDLQFSTVAFERKGMREGPQYAVNCLKSAPSS